MQKLHKYALLFVLALTPVSPLLAKDAPVAQTQVSPLDAQVSALRDEWGRIKYQIADRDEKLQAIAALEEKAAQLTAANQTAAEPKIWEAIILATDAGIRKSVSGLSKVNTAKTLLEQSLQQNPTALDGSAHTTLGSLYYQVPGWPISFGDNKKAEAELKAALAINPDGIDPNYFYGDYLVHVGRYADAVPVLEHALQAPPREGREMTDAGRKAEINVALTTAQQKMKTAKKDGFN